MTIIGLLRWIVRHPLNRARKADAVMRFVRWQLASRLIAQPIALPFVGETRLLVSRGMTGATGNWYCGLHEDAEMGFVLHALRSADLFADIGANVGSYTVLAAGAVGASVIAAEPVPATYERLQANIRLNDLGARVDAQCCGVSDRDGALRFTADLDTMNRIALPDEQRPTISVPVVPLDALCGARRPAIVKIDVEGHEAAVLDGATTVLQAADCLAVLMETNGSGEKFGVSDDQLLAHMAAFGFQPCIYDAVHRRLSRVARGGANTIFVRDVEQMAARCAAAPRYQLVNGSI